jgi:hypothetical protein
MKSSNVATVFGDGSDRKPSRWFTGEIEGVDTAMPSQNATKRPTTHIPRGNAMLVSSTTTSPA